MADPAIQYEDGGPDTSVPARSGLTGADTTGSLSPQRPTDFVGDLQARHDKVSGALAGEYGSYTHATSILDQTEQQRVERDRGRMDQAFGMESAAASDPALNHPWQADKERSERIRGPLENFGSVGTIFALAASAFTRTPMTSALNAAGAAMTAMHQSDEEGYKSAYEAWKANSDLAIKRFNIERNLYEDANKLVSTDLGLWRQKRAALAAQLDDRKRQIMLDAGMDAEVLKADEAFITAGEKSIDFQNKMEDVELTRNIAQEKMQEWSAAHPMPDVSSLPPQEQEKEKGRYALEQFKAKNQFLLEANKQVYESKHPTYGAGGLTSSKDQATRITERTQQLLDSGEEKDPKAAHARAASDIQKADAASRAEGSKEGKKTEATLSKDGIDLAANMLIKGNPAATTNVGRGAQGAANLDAIKNRASEILKEKGMSSEEAATFINNNTAAFMGDKSGARVMANRVATIEQNSHVALATADRVLETSKNVSRTKFSDLNKIILAGEQRTGDPEVIRYGIAVNTFINNYARAVGGSNNSLTNSARNEAHDLLQKYWSQGQVEVAVDQMKKELTSELKGAREAVQGWTKAGVTPDNLTGTVREGKGGQKYKFKGTTQEQMSDKSMWEPI